MMVSRVDEDRYAYVGYVSRKLYGWGVRGRVRVRLGQRHLLTGADVFSERADRRGLSAGPGLVGIVGIPTVLL